MFPAQRKEYVFVSGMGVGATEWGGRELKEEGIHIFYFFTRASMKIQIHFKSEDIDSSSTRTTLLNEIINTSIKYIHTKKSFSLLPRKLDR